MENVSPRVFEIFLFFEMAKYLLTTVFQKTATQITVVCKYLAIAKIKFGKSQKP